jgi:hypothetical protein
MKTFRSGLLLLLSVFSVARRANAHVGSKDVFENIAAGQYKLVVTIRPPSVIPGVATIEARSAGAVVSGINVTSIPMTGEGAKLSPRPGVMQKSSVDASFFSGDVWLMSSGSWQVRFDIDGASGKQTASIPVPALALVTLKMQRTLAFALSALGLFLVCSMAGIVKAAVSEATNKRDAEVGAAQRRRGLAAMVLSLILMAIILWRGAIWWRAEAAVHVNEMYRPLLMQPQLTGSLLDLAIRNFDPTNVVQARSDSDFIPEHGHLMHLYAIREPEMDAVFHLHPMFIQAGKFRLSLPIMPAGSYTFYGDVVHADGLPETLVANIMIPASLVGSPLGDDDAAGLAPPLSAGLLGKKFNLPDGYTMVWNRPELLTPNTAYAFHFELIDPQGKAPNDMQPYMGMAGHAAFVKTDGTVFAHIHPEGSAAMAAVMLANGRSLDESRTPSSSASMAGMQMGAGSNSVEFPYGFPSAGRYRIIVQMKHGTTVETGAFDAIVQ